MPIDGYFITPFCDSGTKSTVPDDTQSDGSVSYTDGYGIDYTLDPATNPDALNIEQDKMNQLFYDITSAIQQYQQTGTPPFITPTMNGGSAYSYSAGNRAQYLGICYTSLVNTNTDTPPSAKWLADNLTPRTKLTGNVIYYVATTGNNSSAGTIGAPWLTIQYAIDYVAKNVDLAGYMVTIQVADGTYAASGFASGPFTGNGTVYLQGNTTTPANCIISTAGAGISAAYGANISVAGFKLVSSAGSCVDAAYGGFINIIGKMEYGISATGYGQIEADDGGRVTVSANYTISAGGGSHFACTRGGAIRVSAAITVTVSGTPAFGSSFANSSGNSVMTLGGITFSGSATGARYSATANATIETSGAGTTYLPGNSGGSTATGGQYI